MKKTLIVTGLIASIGTAAFAAAVPVTSIMEGENRVGLDYAVAQRVSEANVGSDTQHGWGASLQTSLNDKLGAQYAYSKVDLNRSEVKDHQLTGVYRVHDNVNVYGAGTYVDTRKHSGFGYQVGVIGHKPVSDRIDAFAKVGVGNDIKHTVQVGGIYNLRPDVDLNVYYQYDKYDMDTDKASVKGLHAGVGYSF